MTIPIPGFKVAVIGPEIVVLFTALVILLADLFLGKEHKARLAWPALIGVVVAAALSWYLWDSSDPRLQEIFVADGYALCLNLVLLTAAALAILFSTDYVARSGLAQGEYYALLLLATAGLMLMAAAVHLLTLFLALELASLALYILTGLSRAERRAGEAALKYLLLGGLGSALLLYGLALLYGQAGSLTLAGVRAYVASLQGRFPPLLLAGLGLSLAGLGFKVAVVPFHMWTPDVYQGAPTSVTAFMSAGVKAAGFAVLGRLLLYSLGGMGSQWSTILAVLAALTMSAGNLAALRQVNLKRLLAYSSIAHAGYLLTGLAAANEAGASGLLFYLLVYALMNMAAFAVIIAVGRLEGGAERGETIDGFEGLARREPWLAAAMALSLLSLAGVPPLAGFLGKLYLFSAAVQAGLAWLAILGVLNSVVSAYYYLRVVAAMYLKEGKGEAEARAGVCPALQVGLGLATAAIVILGVWPGPAMVLARFTASLLLGG